MKVNSWYLKNEAVMKKYILYFIILISMIFLRCECNTEPDTTAPGTPEIIRATPGDGQVLLVWRQVTDDDVNTYKIYQQSPIATDYTLAVQASKHDTSKSIAGLTNGLNYFFKMKAEDNSGNESTFSNVMSAIPPGGEYYINKAWNYFESNQYDAAIACFDSSLSLYDDFDDAAHTGLGWSYAYKANGSSDVNYVTARNHLQSASNLDASAGLCQVYNVLNQYSNSVSAGKTVIAGNASYVFSHDSFVTITLIRLTVGQSAFELGDYDEVVVQLDIIDSGYTHSADDPEGLLQRLNYVWESLYD